MSKYIILNDLHLSDYTEETVFQILSFAACRAKENDCKVAILGDLYDTVYKDGQIDARLQQRLYNFFSEHFTLDTLFLLPGNHDIYNGYQETALTIFKSIATVYDIATLDSEGILWLPYRQDGYLRSDINCWVRKGAKICFTHNDFKYLSTRKNNLSQNGMDPAIFNGMLVFNGHYHYPNVHGPVICVGSQYTVHRTETFDQKVLYTVNVNGTFSNEKIRFGRREFIYPMDYCRDLNEQYWIPFQKCKNEKIPPPTFPTAHDTLIIEYEDTDDASTDFLSDITHCPIIKRKKPQKITSIFDTEEITLESSIYDNIHFAVKHLYEFSPDLISTSLQEIKKNALKEYKAFNQKFTPLFLERKETRLQFDSIEMNNFCCVRSKKIDFNLQTTKINGPNGSGKTIQYATALLYCVSGVMDDRFSEEKILLSDMQYVKNCNVFVTLCGKINDERFSLKRSYNGKKSTVTFIVNEQNIKFSTTKQMQKEICKLFFNIHIPPGICANKMTHKLMLQRIIWKQNSKSNLLKLKVDSIESLLLQTMNKDIYDALIKHFKQKISKEKNTLQKSKEKLKNLTIVIQERKAISYEENTMLKSWVEYRNEMLRGCKQQLNVLATQTVEKTNTEKYIDHMIKTKTLESKINYFLESKEGTRWNPEFMLNKLEDSYEQLKLCELNINEIEENMKKYTRCLEIFKYIQRILFNRICDIMKNYSNNINLLNEKLKKLQNGEPLKFLSGGEYQSESLALYIDFQLFLKEQVYWKCNLCVFDEPGTAMSNEVLQSFVDKLQKDKCNFIITHKPIKCNFEINLS